MTDTEYSQSGGREWVSRRYLLSLIRRADEAEAHATLAAERADVALDGWIRLTELTQAAAAVVEGDAGGMEHPDCEKGMTMTDRILAMYEGLLQHSSYTTLSNDLLQRMVLAANRDNRRIKAVYILPAATATEDEDHYVFDYHERATGAADPPW